MSNEHAQWKTKDKDLGLPLTIFAQTIPWRSEEQKILFEGSINLCLWLNCRTNGVHMLLIYRLGQWLSNMVNTVLFIPTRKQQSIWFQNQFNDSITVI
jgi:hypothetical protein